VPEKVWVSHECVEGELLSLGAWVSKVRYTFGGVLYEVYLTNDEFTILEEKEIADDDDK